MWNTVLKHKHTVGSHSKKVEESVFFLTFHSGFSSLRVNLWTLLDARILSFMFFFTCYWKCRFFFHPFSSEMPLSLLITWHYDSWRFMQGQQWAGAQGKKERKSLKWPFKLTNGKSVRPLWNSSPYFPLSEWNYLHVGYHRPPSPYVIIKPPHLSFKGCVE